MTEPKLDRRQMLKLQAAAVAATAGGLPVPALAAMVSFQIFGKRTASGPLPAAMLGGAARFALI
jgi:hypothetical protein